MVTEVDEQAQAMPGRVQIVKYLGAMFIRERRDRFEFDKNRSVADQIGDLDLIERTALIGERDANFGLETNALQPEFQLKTLLVNWFQKAAAFLLVNLEARADQSICSSL